jgi:hypothetical protein
LGIFLFWRRFFTQDLSQVLNNSIKMSRTAEDTHELTNLEAEQWSENAHGHHSLPPADRGKEAYLFLASCFMLEALIWGTPRYHQIIQTNSTYTH